MSSRWLVPVAAAISRRLRSAIPPTRACSTAFARSLSFACDAGTRHCTIWFSEPDGTVRGSGARLTAGARGKTYPTGTAWSSVSGAEVSGAETYSEQARGEQARSGAFEPGAQGLWKSGRFKENERLATSYLTACPRRITRRGSPLSRIHEPTKSLEFIGIEPTHYTAPAALFPRSAPGCRRTSPHSPALKPAPCPARH